VRGEFFSRFFFFTFVRPRRHVPTRPPSKHPFSPRSKHTKKQLWRRVSKDVLAPRHPWAVHTLLHGATFAPPAWDAAVDGPAPGWVPTRGGAAATNLARLMRARGVPRAESDPAAALQAFQAASRADPEAFWPPLLSELGVEWETPPVRVLDPPPGGWEAGGDPDGCTWFPGGRLNIAGVVLGGPGSCRDDDAPAIVFASEAAPSVVRTWRLGELRSRAYAAAATLSAAGVRPGDAVALVMPMTPSCVAAYLGIVALGAAVVSVAESLTAREVVTRLRVSKAVVVLTASAVIRGGRALPLYPRVAQAADEVAGGGSDASSPPLPRPRVFVFSAAPDASPSDWVYELTAGSTRSHVSTSGSGSVDRPAVDGVPLLHPSDAAWAGLVAALPAGAAAAFQPVAAPASAAITNVLFSSGTTGTPKAIPWTHVTPLRCGVDAWGSLDVRPRDTLAWPTSLGWMMGPFLVYGALLNSAALALFEGAPTGRAFCEFVQAARVTCLGTVPSLARAWRATGAIDGLDWGGIRAFGSTGEASSPDDALWLASRARYAPVLELCGGTEVGGGYAAGNRVQPWAPSTFAGPALGADFVLLEEDGGGGGEDEGGGGGGGAPKRRQSRHAPGARPAAGEVALIPPALGLSQRLLNGDHGAAYFGDMPTLAAGDGPGPGAGTRLRRHGDGLARLPSSPRSGGVCAYAARGRVDDAMNLGGIKVAAVELEAAVTGGRGFEGVAEVAAVAVPAPGGGPDALVLVVVPAPSSSSLDPAALAAAGTASLRAALSPLFRVDRVVVRPGGLPRTATGKVMRRVLRDELSRGGGGEGGGSGGRAKL
jgi:acetyl-CoA synthetase